MEGSLASSIRTEEQFNTLRDTVSGSGLTSQIDVIAISRSYGKTVRSGINQIEQAQIA